MAHAENADQLTKLYVEITTSCNLDCQMCLRRAWNEPLGRMPMAVFANLMRQVSRFPAPPTIHLGGYGEPTTHPDFLEMVRLAKAAGARVEATTNGTLLDADMSTALIEAEMDRLVVSVDGVTPESYEDIRVYGSFKQVIENLKTLQRLKIRYRGRHSPRR